MRPEFPAALLIALFPACGGSPASPPNAADKPGGATNIQPGSGGSYNDVVRSEGADPEPPPETTGRPVDNASSAPEPKTEPAPPHGKP